MAYKSITFVSWNVETFGDAANATRGANYQPICDFIANVLYQLQADIFLLMELRSGGTAYLGTLLTSLNNVFNTGVNPPAWLYDYIPGAVINTNPVVPRPPANFNQMGFLNSAHSEGYALFWRPDATKFTMMNARDNISYNSSLMVAQPSKISLVFNGRNPAWNANAGWYTAANFDPAIPPAPWPALDFCIPNPAQIAATQWDSCRRACYFVINMPLASSNAAADRMFPFAVMHAPFKLDRSTPWVTQLSGFSRQLYQPDDSTQVGDTPVSVNQALISGDFNINASDTNDVNIDAYKTMTNSFDLVVNGNNVGGAACGDWVGTTEGDSYSAIRLSGSGGNITSVNPMAYRWLAIDRLYYRNANQNISPITPNSYGGPVYDLITAVMKIGNGPYQQLVSSGAKRTVIQSFHTAITTEFGTGNYTYTEPNSNTPCRMRSGKVGNYKYSGYLVPSLLDYDEFIRQIQRGYFSNARQAAEFIYNCVSDHLPIVFRFRISV